MIDRITPVLATKIILVLCAASSLVVGLPYVVVLFRNGNAVAPTIANEQNQTPMSNLPVTQVAPQGLALSKVQAALLLSVSIALVLLASLAFYLVPLVMSFSRQQAEVESQSVVRSLQQQVAKLEKDIKSLRDKESEQNIHCLSLDKERKKFENECSRLQQLLSNKEKAEKEKRKEIEIKQQLLVDERIKLDELKRKSTAEVEALQEENNKLEQQKSQLASECRDAQVKQEALKADIGQLRVAKLQLEQKRDALSQRNDELDAKWDEVEQFHKNRADNERILKDQATELESNERQLRDKRESLGHLIAQEESITRACDQKKAEAEAIHKDAQQQRDEAARREQQVAEREGAVAERERRAQERELQQNAESLRLGEIAANAAMDRAAAESKLQESQTAREEEASIRTEKTKLLNQIKEFRTNNWPAWIVGGALLPTLDQLESWVTAGDGYARLLLSNLQVLKALEAHEDFSKDFKFLSPTVRDVGRFLAQSLVRQGYSSEETSQVLVEWAKAINLSFAGKCRLSVPAIGSAFDPLEMQSVGGPIKTVTRVHNWSVINARAITEMKAEVS